MRHFISLEESIGHRSVKEKLIVFINVSKNINATGPLESEELVDLGELG
jgi:hypothetical protein